MRRKKQSTNADSSGGAEQMKPIRKVQTVKEIFPTFVTPETLEDLLHVHWSSMKLIKDDDEVTIDFNLPDMIDVIIKVKKGKDSRSRYRMLNGGS